MDFFPSIDHSNLQPASTSGKSLFTFSDEISYSLQSVQKRVEQWSASTLSIPCSKARSICPQIIIPKRWQVVLGSLGSDKSDGITNAVGLVSCAILPFAATSMIGYLPIAAACGPPLMVLPIFTDLPLPIAVQAHSQGIFWITILQGLFSSARIVQGDLFGGVYGLMLAVLGHRARLPGPARVWLKTYVLITFINGVVSTLEMIQSILLLKGPLLSLSLPWTVNLLHLMIVGNPLMSFLGAYFGWQFIKCLKQLAVQDAQMRMSIQSGMKIPVQLPQEPACPPIPEEAD